MLEKNLTLNRNVYQEKGGAYRMYGKQERCVQVLVGRPVGKELLGRPD
jgi:hypothetical protein